MCGSDTLCRIDSRGADMQHIRQTAPIFALLVVVATSLGHATVKSQDSAWVKLCEKATVTKDKDGNDEKKEVNICLTHKERLDANSGMVLVSAAVITERSRQAVAAMLF